METRRDGSGARAEARGCARSAERTLGRDPAARGAARRARRETGRAGARLADMKSVAFGDRELPRGDGDDDEGSTRTATEGMRREARTRTRECRRRDERTRALGTGARRGERGIRHAARRSTR